MNTGFYLIRAVSNLHPGAGDASFGLIDKIVQRDTVTDLPTIFASSIKGAMRQIFEVAKSTEVTHIFGSDNKGGGQNDLEQGHYTFFDAKLLALPIRSNYDLYYVATTVPLIEEFREDLKRFGLQAGMDGILEDLIAAGENASRGKPIYLAPAPKGNLYLEDLSAAHESISSDKLKALEPLFGERIALLDVRDFAELAEALPTVARNSLDNGISTNLWYEEIVPRETRFYCPMAWPEGEDNKAFSGIEKRLLQVGANATVGQGLTEWSAIATQPAQITTKQASDA